jgi:hypothetical protein
LAGTYPSLTTLDGTIIQSSLLGTNLFAPCITGTDLPTVTIGSVSGLAVEYAGFVANSVAGLYQVNVQIPTPTALGITSATQLPISVTSNGVTSQTGVSIWVVPALGVTGPTGNGLTGAVGVQWNQGNAVITASQGSGTYTYAITSGVLPTGLSLVTVGQTVVIEGAPAAGTSGQYLVTVTATDTTAGTPLTGSVSFTLTVAGGLYLSSTGTAPYTSTYGSATNLTTVTATGGVLPYTYAITSPSSVPAGMSINTTTGVLSVNQLTPDGTYTVGVTATDASGNLVTGTGSITFTVEVAPQISQVYENPAIYTAGQASNISTVTAAGASGASFTYALAPNTPAYVTLVNNVVGVTTGAPASNSISVTVIATDTNVPADAASGGTAQIVVTVADH